MNGTMKRRFILLCAVLMLLLPAFSRAEAAKGMPSCRDYNGKRIAVNTGSSFDLIIHNALPEAEIVYINTAADMIAALESGRIDAFAVDEPLALRVNP